MKISDIITEDHVLINSPETSKERIIERMVFRVCEASGLPDREAALEAVLKRERKKSTGVACGLAVPHGKLTSIDRMYMAAATTSQGLDFQANDGEPVFLLFLILSPQSTTGPHVRALSTIARIVSDAEIRKNLISAPTPADFYRLLRLGEEKYT